ncbi:glycosyltransferase [Nocardioides sp.]|uniref:glycosyltransferase n=1 Tax=Nocardioides sp. TaxID=35761 RepID=UPI002ECFE376
MSRRVIYVVRSWPRLSQTFVLNEVLALERRGIDLAIFALVHSEETVVQPQVAEVRAPLTVLTRRRRALRARLRAHGSVLTAAPQEYAATLWFALRHPSLAAGYTSGTALQCFDHAVTVAARVLRMRQEGVAPDHLHAHFAHDPALVGLLAARLTGLPFSFTGHARDLLQIPPAALAARAAAATALVTCCEANAEHIEAAVPAEARPPVLVVHHGVDLARFRPAAADPGRLPTILSVGRLVEKKGYDDLLQALALLRATSPTFRCDVYGDGPLRPRLLELRDQLGLRDHVVLHGACSNDRVLAALASATVFTLAPRHTEDGDRDGIPNVLVEAMACAVPVVTTAAGGIPELLRHEENGLLVPPGDVPALAAGIRRLLGNPWLQRRLGTAGRATVARDYDVHDAAQKLELVFRGSVGSERPRDTSSAMAVAP